MASVAEAQSQDGVDQHNGPGRINHHNMSGAIADGGAAASWGVVVLCFAAVLLDGLDTSSIGVAAPAIAAHFNISPAALTPAFVATSLGAVVGYLASGPLASRWPARRVLIASVAAFGALSLVSPFARSVEQLALLRLATAIGLGAALPSAISIASKHCAPRLRATVAVIVGTGLAAGGIIGGVLGAALTAKFGWQSIFFIGGALPLALSLILLFGLPRPVSLQAAAPTGDGEQNRGGLRTIVDLFAAGLAIRTISLWIFSFLIFAVGYALIFWLPSLLGNLGFSPEYSQLGISFFSAGGLVANVAVMLLLSRFRVALILLLAVLIGVICAAGLAVHAAVPVAAWLLIAGAGAGLISCSVGQSALAVSIYPEALRTHGVGFSAAAGRLGSVVGPALVGLLVSAGITAKVILLAATVPALIAVLALLPHLQRGESTEPGATAHGG